MAADDHNGNDEQTPVPQSDPRASRAAALLVGDSPALRSVRQRLVSVAQTDLAVLLLGETGTGKGLAARVLHDLSPRSSGPFIRVNCGALPEDLLTDAVLGGQPGALLRGAEHILPEPEAARAGTVFLDQVGDLPPGAQAVLSGLLDDDEYGGGGNPQDHARVVAAGGQDLEVTVAQGLFRAELYYRLGAPLLYLPPLREHPQDIPALAQHFIRLTAADLGRPAPRLSKTAEALLLAHDWPGNVRELRHTVQGAVLACPGTRIGPGDVPAVAPPASGRAGQPFLTLEECERQYIRQVLEATGWTVKGARGAAALLGLRPTALNRRLKKLGLVRPGTRK